MYMVLAFIVIALAAGFIADFLVGRGRQYERWELFVVGIIGSFVGGTLFVIIDDLMNSQPIDWLQAISITGLLGSILGAIIVLAIYGPVRDRLRANQKPATPAGKNTAIKPKKK